MHISSFCKVNKTLFKDFNELSTFLHRKDCTFKKQIECSLFENTCLQAILSITIFNLRKEPLCKVEKILKDGLKSNPIIFNFIENSKLLVGKFAQGIKAKRQQTFNNKKFIDNAQQCFALDNTSSNIYISRPYFELSLKLKHPVRK